MFRQHFYPMLTAVIASGLLLMQTAQAAPVAVVNGDPISQKTYEQYLKYRTQGQKDKATSVNRKALINELVNRKLLLQEAKKAKLHKDPEIKFRIEQQEMDILIQARPCFRSKPRKIRSATRNYAKNTIAKSLVPT